MKTFFEENLLNSCLVVSASNFFQHENFLFVKFLDNMPQARKFNHYHINDYFYTKKKRNFIFTNSVLNKVDAFSLPKSLQGKLKNAIRYMELRLLEWIEANYDLIPSDPTIFPKALEWTGHGKVDILKTITNIVNNEDVPVYNRLLLSCRFCIEEKVVGLWDRILDDSKTEFLSSINSLHFYWSTYLQDQSSPPNQYITHDSIYTEQVIRSLLQNNFLAFKYFWDKISPSIKIYLHPFFYSRDMDVDLILFLHNHSDIPKETFLEGKKLCMLEASLKNWVWHENLQLESYESLFGNPVTQQRLFFDIINLLEMYHVKDKLYSWLLLFWRVFSLKFEFKVPDNALLRLLKMGETQILLTLLKDLPAQAIKEFLIVVKASKKNLFELNKTFVLDEMIRLVCTTEEEFVKFKRSYLSGRENPVYESEGSLSPPAKKRTT